MKKFICLISIAGLISMGSCDNANRGVEVNEEEGTDVLDERDTSAIEGEFNTRGVPTQGIPDNNAIREDSIAVGGDDNALMDELPAAVSEKIRTDESLSSKRLTNSRQYSEGGVTYYELTFDNDESTKLLFDSQGNQKPNP